ncbi:MULTISPECIES: hypothetical protein [unclassified Pseudomonas]|uniref:hypothetical protein n=1 Tax=unclassified Pseudomonas TaxID=196821 RepID=UPI000C86ABEB|nr:MULTISPECIES: hypothetical protein [unclassified Pseudomonas]MBU0521678.1 hypothetical protein [Gammaproteobacteria bacterium]MBU0840550.1 hypothetical protein [Gammaproteobacteria bacterium]MBU1838324.1 hypothetical protein [Gammaproteobacteria bacterium]PMV91992.1 hypothetical protein C1X55_29705 [Pseudomonas sp. GW460-C8]PMW10544.1 hypothetical protein C1X40_30275 [Pseudomonas sp. GW456-11-11-14-TSB2]
MSQKKEGKDELADAYATVPKHLEGLVDAAFRMVEEGQDPTDVLKMVSYGLEKRRLTTEQ